jgi:hypothetical protein
VIKTQQGRIVGTAGLALDWRGVHFPVAPPAWSAVNTAPFNFTRVHDEIPVYRFGMLSSVSVESVAGLPAITLPSSLPTDVARTYVWYRETPSTASLQVLPPSWFAVAPYHGKPTVVYSFQCLSKQLCLSLQRWPLEKAPF